ncbi:DMT family transporter [Afifella sp. IM 167]|uniref:DMT family transporter n=1 Tax=Afifella sp. IM 167 TaxID=2033586 RepID=UPI001CCDB821|nr:DMT family transporter [Afifella sp. IM 167]
MARLEQTLPPRSVPLGIGAIVLAVFLLSLSDALVKLTSDRLAAAQFFALRSAIAAGLILAATAAMNRLPQLRLQRPGWVLLRSGLLSTMWVAYYLALPAMSFALAAAALYTAPLFMAVFARIFLGEPIGRRRWAAIAMGLLGVILILRPDPSGLSALAALPFLAACCYALAAIVTWRHCPAERPLAMALNLNLVLGMTGGIALAALALFPPDPALAAAYPFAFRLWPALEGSDLMLVALLALFIVVIATAVAKAYQMAPSPVIGLFDNAYLAFAAIWSALFFHEMPDLAGGVGIGLIALAALLSVRGGRRKRR